MRKDILAITALMVLASSMPILTGAGGAGAPMAKGNVVEARQASQADIGPGKDIFS